MVLSCHRKLRIHYPYVDATSFLTVQGTVDAPEDLKPGYLAQQDKRTRKPLLLLTANDSRRVSTIFHAPSHLVILPKSSTMTQRISWLTKSDQNRVQLTRAPLLSRESAYMSQYSLDDFVETQTVIRKNPIQSIPLGSFDKADQSKYLISAVFGLALREIRDDFQ
jgi:hypothetical protein